MKRNLLIALIVVLFISIPVSVYAINNQQNSFMYNNRMGYTNTGSSNYIMGPRMGGFNCFNSGQNIDFLKEQIARVEQQLASGKITQEEADYYINMYQHMLAFHEQYNQNQD